MDLERSGYGGEPANTSYNCHTDTVKCACIARVLRYANFTLKVSRAGGVLDDAELLLMALCSLRSAHCALLTALCSMSEWLPLFGPLLGPLKGRAAWSLGVWVVFAGPRISRPERIEVESR